LVGGHPGDGVTELPGTGEIVLDQLGIIHGRFPPGGPNIISSDGDWLKLRWLRRGRDLRLPGRLPGAVSFE
jgi:hypothetical protein